MGQWPIPQEKTSNRLLVFFCIPNTREWRGMVTAHLNNFTYGRAWDEKTGSIKEAQAIGREIMASMSMCDLDELRVELSRIASALEQSNTYQARQTITLDEALAEMQASEIGELADMVEVLQFLSGLLPNLSLPSIPIGDLVQMYTTWRWRQSILNLAEDAVVSQRVQATAQMGDSGHTLYSLFDDPLETLLLPTGWAGRAVWLWNRLKPSEISGWASWASTVAGLLLGSIRGAGYSIAEAVGGLGQVIQDKEFGGGAGPAGGCEPCNTAGQIGQPGEASPGNCTVPDDWSDWLEWRPYRAAAANNLVLSVERAFQTFGSMPAHFTENSRFDVAGDYMSIQRIYSRVAGRLNELLEPLILNTFTQESRAFVQSNLANRYDQMHYDMQQNDIWFPDPAYTTLASNYWDIFYDISGEIEANRNQLIQDIFDQQTSQGVKTYFQTKINDYIDSLPNLASYEIVGSARLLATEFITMALCNCLFAQTDGAEDAGNAFEPAGQAGCCWPYLLAIGEWTDQEPIGTQHEHVLASEFANGYHTIDLYFNCADVDISTSCNEPVAPFAANETGFTSIGADSWQIFDQFGNVSDSADQNWYPAAVCGHRLLIRSSSHFTVEIFGEPTTCQ